MPREGREVGKMTYGIARKKKVEWSFFAASRYEATQEAVRWAKKMLNPEALSDYFLFDSHMDMQPISLATLQSEKRRD